MIWGRRRRDTRDGTAGSASGERAIIDIGSNTVRLVVYGGTMRAPIVLVNEKVTAKLGREIATTGRLADEAMAQALRGLKRYATRCCWPIWGSRISTRSPPPQCAMRPMARNSLRSSKGWD